MTKQRIREIKRRTVGKAKEELLQINFSDTMAAFRVGEILGELDSNLERELYKEMNFRNRINNKTYFNVNEREYKSNVHS